MARSPELTPLSELPPIGTEADERLMPQLTEHVVPLINRHINPKRFKDPELRDEFPSVTTYMGDNADLWTPALMVPWSLGENFPDGYDWKSENQALPQAARSSLVIGLLTEDNLPWYAETIKRRFSSNEALSFWNRLWVAEEDRHSDVMRNYMTVARLVDPVELEQDRMAQVITAETPQPPSAIESMVYVSMQELATRISHQNTGRLIADTALVDQGIAKLNEDRTKLHELEPAAVNRMEPEQRNSYIRQVGRAIMTRVAGDENKHYAFYRDVAKAASQMDPSNFVKATEKEVRGFQMPGTGIRDFWTHAVTIADAGVYDIPIHHGQILAPLLKFWKFEELDGLDDEAERARERTLQFMESLGRLSTRFTERREAKRAKLADDPNVIWVGKAAA